jgi:hypothetical protein
MLLEPVVVTALRTVLALPFNSLSWENSFRLRLPATDWELTLYRPPDSGQTQTLTSSAVLRGAGHKNPARTRAGGLAQVAGEVVAQGVDDADGYMLARPRPGCRSNPVRLER